MLIACILSHYVKKSKHFFVEKVEKQKLVFKHYATKLNGYFITFLLKIQTKTHNPV
jgi:hypothetical protein